MERCTAYHRCFRPLIALLSLLLLSTSVHGADASFDAVTAEARYQAWYPLFAEDYQAFMQRKQEGSLNAQQINEIFADSVVPGSEMTASLMEFSAYPEERTPLLETLISVMGDAKPVGFGGTTGKQQQNIVWYMAVTPKDLKQKEKMVVPPYGELVEKGHPYLVFSESDGQLLLTKLPRPFGVVVGDIHAARTFIFSF